MYYTLQPESSSNISYSFRLIFCCVSAGFHLLWLIKNQELSWESLVIHLLSAERNSALMARCSYVIDSSVAAIFHFCLCLKWRRSSKLMETRLFFFFITVSLCTFSAAAHCLQDMNPAPVRSWSFSSCALVFFAIFIFSFIKYFDEFQTFIYMILPLTSCSTGFTTGGVSKKKKVSLSLPLQTCTDKLWKQQLPASEEIRTDYSMLTFNLRWFMIRVLLFPLRSGSLIIAFEK